MGLLPADTDLSTIRADVLQRLIRTRRAAGGTHHRGGVLREAGRAQVGADIGDAYETMEHGRRWLRQGSAR